MRIDDLLICLSYFSIPIQLALVLYQYPWLGKMPHQLVILGVLFIFFILLCGCGHMLRALELHATQAFDVLNWCTCAVSVTTALYLLPTAPTIVGDLDTSLQALVKLNEETAASKRKLFTFMSFLCHEIRNPLFAITSNIEFAQDMIMSQVLEESLQSINQSASLMLRLVNDVLDLSKIESGKLELDIHEFDIREFFQNLASSMNMQVQAKRLGAVKFVFNMNPGVPRLVRGDSVRVLQIAYNVLSNACKFTETGTITFSLDVLHKGQSAKQMFDESRPHQQTSDSSAPALRASAASVASANASVAQPKRESDGNESDHTGQSNGLQSVEAFSMSLFGESANKKDKKARAPPHSSATRRVLGRILEGTASFARSHSEKSVGALDDKDSDSSNHNGKNDDEADCEYGRIRSTVDGDGGDDNNIEMDDEDLDSDLMILRMSFQDTGIGIDKEQLDRIFQPYAQSKLSDFRKHGGTGLGLSIISKLLEMMGGTVKVHSVVGEGSTFVIHLPLRVPREQMHEVDGTTETGISYATLDTEMEDSSNRNYTSASGPVVPITSALGAAGLPTASEPTLNGNAAEMSPAVAPLFNLATASASPLFSIAPEGKAPAASPLFVLPTTATTSTDALQDPKTTSSAPFTRSDTGDPTTNGVAAPPPPLFAVNNNIAPQPPSASAGPIVLQAIGTPVTNGGQGRIVPHSQPTSAPATKVRQLSQFHFEPNNNLVLVVDDNAVNRKLLGRMLTYFNLEFKTAENGQVGVDIMKESRNATGDPSAPHFGMVLMDLSMPVMDGYEAILTLRKKMGLDVPIVALTANAMEEERRKSLENGASEFATKPILRAALHAKCILYLSPKTQQSSVP